MRPSSAEGRLSVILVCVLVVVAACTIEVNINTNDEEPTNPIITVAPTAPTPAAPTPPEAPRADRAPLPAAPTPPPPPVIAPVQPDPNQPVRDALLRYERVVPRPSPAPAIEELLREPAFTPFTTAPSILNSREIIDAMEKSYPPLLRDAGIGGTVRVYFLIDEEGATREYRIDNSSGHPALDEAALRVASVYRFSAALNRDERVPVWVSFPITFQTR